MSLRGVITGARRSLSEQILGCHQQDPLLGSASQQAIREARASEDREAGVRRRTTQRRPALLQPAERLDAYGIADPARCQSTKTESVATDSVMAERSVMSAPG